VGEKERVKKEVEKRALGMNKTDDVKHFHLKSVT